MNANRIARIAVITVGVLVASLCVGVVAHGLFLHEHPPGEEQLQAHEGDPYVWGLLVGLGGMFATIAVSAWRRWRWWVRLFAVLVAPFATIAVVLVLFFAANWVIGLSR